MYDNLLEAALDTAFSHVPCPWGDDGSWQDWATTDFRQPTDQDVLVATVVIETRPYAVCQCRIGGVVVLRPGEGINSLEAKAAIVVQSFVDEYQHHSFEPVNLAEHARRSHWTAFHMDADALTVCPTCEETTAYEHCEKCCAECAATEADILAAEDAYRAQEEKRGGA